MNLDILNNPGSGGVFWSSTVDSSSGAYRLNFNSTNVDTANYSNKYYGRTIRRLRSGEICRRFEQVGLEA